MVLIDLVENVFYLVKVGLTGVCLFICLNQLVLLDETVTVSI
jgi:hypothetical protein